MQLSTINAVLGGKSIDEAVKDRDGKGPTMDSIAAKEIDKQMRRQCVKDQPWLQELIQKQQQELTKTYEILVAIGTNSSYSNDELAAMVRIHAATAKHIRETLTTILG